MTFRPLTDEREIQRAFDRLRNQLIDGAVAYVRKIGYQGGNVETPVYWRPQEHFWTCFNPVNYPSEFLCQYGVLDPANRRRLHATVEINSPKCGSNRRTAGAFVENDDHEVFLAHSGRVTTTSATNYSFKDFCTGVVEENVFWPKGKPSKMFLIGRVDDETLREPIAKFVREVARYKESQKSQASGR